MQEWVQNLLQLMSGVLGIFVIQELFSYILDHIFDKAEKSVPSILKIIRDKQIEKFYSIRESDEYKRFEYEYLRTYYGEKFFTEIYTGEKIPVYTIQYDYEQDKGKKIDTIRYYDKLGNREGVEFSFDLSDHQGYKKNKYYLKYKWLVGKNIKAPDRPGFMLDKLICNERGMIQFRAFVGTYAENVYSNHVLEYELYKLYRLYWKKKRSMEQLCRDSHIRNAMHVSALCGEKCAEQMKKSLESGEGRQSLLGVQMLVLIRKADDYTISIIERSKSVAVAPGRFQLVPSGGFEIFNESQTEYSTFEIKDNYSAGCAVFREYLEEIFGVEECEGTGTGSVKEMLNKDTRIRELEEMLSNGKAEFRFLGSVMDLAGLRHELSFVLVIHDEQYQGNQFKGNEEGKNRKIISDVYLSDFENRKDIWKNLHGPSAAMWMLFKNSGLYEKLKNNM